MRIKGLTRMFRGSRASSAPRLTPNPPKCRPIQPKLSYLGSFHRDGLHLGRNANRKRDLTTTNRGELRHPRLRHAGDTPSEGFAWRKTPTATGLENAGGPGRPGRSAREQQGAAIARQLAPGLRQSTTLFAQQEARRAASVQNSPSTSRTAPLPVQNSPCTPLLTACAVQNSPCTPALAAFPVQNSPCTPEMAQFGAFYACRESFVPLSPPRSQAGRILYRTQGRDGARQHNSTPPQQV